MKKKIWKVIFFLAGVLALVLLISAVICGTVIHIQPYTVALDGMETPVRLVVISDLHGKRFGKDDARLLRAVRQARPDLIALTGDFADELTELSALEPLLEGLTALAPVFYVTGNHEWVMDGAQRRELFNNQFKVGDVAKVKIVKLMTFGAFAEIIPGVDGLIHISQIADRRIGKPEDVLSEGQEVDAKIIDIDQEHKRISLSIRALIAPANESEDEAE